MPGYRLSFSARGVSIRCLHQYESHLQLRLTGARGFGSVLELIRQRILYGVAWEAARLIRTVAEGVAKAEVNGNNITVAWW